MVGESICLAVAGRYLSEEGEFVLNARLASAPPPNDRCVNAQPLAFPDEVVAENFASRPESGVFPCPSGEFGLWYSFTAPAEGVYKFDARGAARHRAVLDARRRGDGLQRPAQPGGVGAPDGGATGARAGELERVHAR